jgi:hypothetical protein
MAPPDLDQRVRKLELQSHTILWLSGGNLFLNAAMLLLGFLLGTL